MRSSLRKLRNLTLNRSISRDKKSALNPQLQHGDGAVSPAPNMQVLTDMQEQCDGLLAAAQTISGSSYDFSRSIREMASYMVETFGKTGNGELGTNLGMLAKVQYEISKLFDLYSTHVSQTIIKPTENLLKELELVEEFNKQFEKKRYLYNQMRSQKPKGRQKKADALDQQLIILKEQLDEQAMQLDLRFQSLKHGQELSLMTQAARHHTAQVHLFAKGLNSLKAVDSMIKQLSTEFHIDDTLSEGESGIELHEDTYETGMDFSGHHDEDASSSSSRSSFEPMTVEEKEHTKVGTQKPWEHISKSAPLHPPSYITKIASAIQELEEEPSYALPNPKGPTAGCNNQANKNASKVDLLRVDELPVLGKIRTSTAVNSEEARGSGLSNLQSYNQSDVKHAFGREAAHAFEETSSYHARRSSSHSYSTSFSEGLDPLSASSRGQSGFLMSTPTLSYKCTARESDMIRMGTHLVDPLYKSGPVGHSAPWGLAQSRVSPPLRVSPPILTPTRVSPCASPPVSHLSPPLISELHKLPAPPPPPPPPKSDSVVAHSGPLGRKSGHKLRMLTSLTSSSLVKKSRSIPSSVNFSQNFHHTKVIRSGDSPVVESP